LLLDPVEDEVVGLWSLELRGHVSSSVHGCEGEVSVFLVDSCILVIDIVVGEIGSVGPSSGFDPVD